MRKPTDRTPPWWPAVLCVLTVLGAMLYLREGWLVGSTGLGGALIVILAAYTITGTTALSVSSIATNVRVPPGGAFAIIAQALGLEAGGAIGLPLFVAQAASAIMYLYAFSEGWAYLFPAHDPMVVVSAAFLAGASFFGASCSMTAWGTACMVVRRSIEAFWIQRNASGSLRPMRSYHRRYFQPRAFLLWHHTCGS